MASPDLTEALIEILGVEAAARLAKLINERLDRDVEPGIPIGQAQMEAMAEIIPEDVFFARVDWYASEEVPIEFKRLLDAEGMSGG